jgi:hypothetical protein
VLAWFCANPMLPQAEVRALVDCIEHRRAEMPGFSIKGRSAIALLRPTWAIEAGQCAIWTLTLRDDTGHWRRLTIEVRPPLRQIVQARGRFNAMPEPRDILALEAWATRNKLSISQGRW